MTPIKPGDIVLCFGKGNKKYLVKQVSEGVGGLWLEAQQIKDPTRYVSGPMTSFELKNPKKRTK